MFPDHAAEPHAAGGGHSVHVSWAAEPTGWFRPRLSPQIGLQVRLATKDVKVSSAEREIKEERSKKKSLRC